MYVLLFFPVNVCVTLNVSTYMHTICISTCVCVCLCLWRGEEVNSYQSVFATGMVIMAAFNNYALQSFSTDDACARARAHTHTHMHIS